MNKLKIKEKYNVKRIGFIVIFVIFMVFVLAEMYLEETLYVTNGIGDLTGDKFHENQVVRLSGQWNFYWGKLLEPDEFISKELVEKREYIKVPGSWHDNGGVKNVYPDYGIGTYHVNISYLSEIKDPAIRIENVTSAYRIYANGQLIREVGIVSEDPKIFDGGYEKLIIPLPSDGNELDLVIQVANYSYARGGLRKSPIFGSQKALEYQKVRLLYFQLFFTGGIFLFSLYYGFVFLLQRKNRTALIFSLLCLNTAIHASLLGETPLLTLLPNMPFSLAVKILYFTLYNLVPLMMLFIRSIYPKEFNKKVLMIILLVTLFFEVLLLGPIELMSSMSRYFFIFEFLQMFYILDVLIKAVLNKKDNSLIMMTAIGVYVLSIVGDIFISLGIGKLNLISLTIIGNIVVVIIMSFIQAKEQAITHKNLIKYNESLIESDRLKDKVMETESSFLQAQIKPHFLYNALSAIANVCEKDGNKASGLILDLATYLRGSLEFNNLNKLTTIEKELEFVDTYFNIEQVRFGNKIKLVKEINVPLNYQIPVLVLQPLVENAVRHGISKKREGGTVYIKMDQVNEVICIEIIDDGVGINDSKFNELFNGKGNGVGLLNIHNRLFRLYGKGLDISSEIGSGTKARFVIVEEEDIYDTNSSS